MESKIEKKSDRELKESSLFDLLNLLCDIAVKAQSTKFVDTKNAYDRLFHSYTRVINEKILALEKKTDTHYLIRHKNPLHANEFGWVLNYPSDSLSHHLVSSMTSEEFDKEELAQKLKGK